MTTCPSCKSPVDVPADHDAETIRCGICWAEVEIGIHELAPIPASVEMAEEAKPVPKADHFAGIPGRPAPGMAPLEDLLRNVGERMPHLLKPVKVKKSKQIEAPPPTVVESHRPSARRVEEEGLRRKRGAKQSSYAIEADKSEEEAASSSKPLLAVIVAVVVFFVAFLVFQYLF
jgi:hypothetical protein